MHDAKDRLTGSDCPGLPDPTPLACRSRYWTWICQERVIVVAICILMTAAFHYEVVFLHRTIVPLNVPGVMPGGPYQPAGAVRTDWFRPDRGASAWQVMAWIRKVHEEFARGALPVWNDHQGFGSPLLGNALAGVLDPTLLPLYFNGTPESWDAYYVLRTLAGLLVTYAYARQIGLVPLASIYFAVAYVFCGHFFLFNNNTWITGYLTLPGILLGTELLQAQMYARGMLIAASSIALALVNGMPEVSLFVLTFAALYAALGLVLMFWQPRASSRFMSQVLYQALTWGIGLALAAPLVFTLAEYAMMASRTQERVSNGLLHVPLPQLATFFVPYINGRTLDPGYSFTIGSYVGAATIPLALLGLCLPRSHELRRTRLVFLVIAAVFFAKLVGAPVLNDIGAYPPFSVATFPRWAAPVAGFALTALGAIGVHSLVTVRPSLWTAGGVLFGSLAVLLASIAASYDGTPAVQHPRSYLVLALAVVVGMGLAVFARRTGLRAFAPTCCVAIAAVELFLLSPRGAYADRSDWFTTSPYLEMLQQAARESSFRVFSGDDILFPNTGSSFGISDIRAVEALYPERYMEYIRAVVNESVTDRFTGSTLWSSEAMTSVAGNPWLDLTGVRYVLAWPASPTATAIESTHGISSLDRAVQTCPPQVPRPCAQMQWSSINGVNRIALSQHAPSTVSLPVHVPADRSYMTFNLGMPPELWDPAKGNGVTFELRVDGTRGSQNVFRRQIDPKNRPEDRRWYPAMVDLGPYSGQDVTLSFVVDDLQDNAADVAVWGDLSFEPGAREVLLEQVRGVSCTPRADVCGKATRATFDQVTRAAFKVDIGSTLRKRFSVDQSHTALTLAPLLTVSPSEPPPDGEVVFQVDVSDVATRQILESRQIVKRYDSRPFWDYVRIDLSRYVGRDVETALSTTTSARDTGGVAVFWGDVHTGRMDEQYVKVYDREVVVYQNLLAAPRAFLVGEARPAADLPEARQVMRDRQINPSRTVVLEATGDAVLPASEEVRGAVRVVDQTATALVLDVTTDRPAVVLMTDTFYPGWQASVDGQTVPIYAADVAFRGVLVDAGEHRLVVTYRSTSVIAGLLVAAIGVLALSLSLVSLAYRPRHRRPAWTSSAT